MDNENPCVFESAGERPLRPEDGLDDVHDAIDSREIFGMERKGGGERVIQCNNDS